MKAFFLTGSAALLLACGVTVFPAMAGGKIVNLTLRVLVDGPPPCSVKGSAVEFGNVIIKSIDGANYRQPVGYTRTAQTVSATTCKCSFRPPPRPSTAKRC